MAVAVVPALDLDKPKLQKLQRAGILKLIDQRRCEPQEQQRQVPIQFWDLGRLLQQVDAKLLQIFKNQQTMAPFAQQEQAQ